GMNPCIDCRIFMFKKAKEYMQEVGASFIITGEVLGQRPMSQNRMAMKIIEKESGLEGLILRPLTSNGVNSNSKNILKDIELNKLPNISGRSRKKQLSLAKTLNIENYICGTGGCSLTDKEFIKRLKDYFEYNKENNLDEIKLLKIGRHFRLDNNTKLIVGRNEEENKTLNNYRDMGIFFVPIKRGPNALVIGENVNPAHLKLAGRIIGRYCKDDETEFTYTHKAETKNINLIPFKHEELGSYRI
ncbi:MAG: hypothetical protein OEV44_14305, partial [Spirochaetota bacterium]|nr:hypothetical protein [Spirochaetota bacterium]